MDVFVVVIRKPSEQIREAIEREFPGSYEHSDTTWFLAPSRAEHNRLLCHQVAERIGLVREDEDDKIVQAAKNDPDRKLPWRKGLWSWNKPPAEVKEEDIVRDEIPGGVVIRWDAYSGFDDRSLWEWVRVVRNDQEQ